MVHNWIDPATLDPDIGDKEAMMFTIYDLPLRFIIIYSNMTWFISPIKSTDTNSALFSRYKHWQ